MTTTSNIIIDIHDLKLRLNGNWIHKGLNLSIKQGEVCAIVGRSGSGKTQLLHQILLLQHPTSGSIKIFGKETTTADKATLQSIKKRWGVLFQQGALFSSLTTLENVAFPLRENTTLDKKTIKQLAMLKLLSVGLTTKDALKYPNELSGGMQKRAALARACVLDPELLFLDEPSAGLDPDSAAGLDELILNLKETLGLTIILITHDLDSLWAVADKVAFLGEGKILEEGSMNELVKSEDPIIHQYFSGPRGRIATEIYQSEQE
jgi:phospholipid/cholesterol/gamma-HCH transport system ATP-binding protein